MCKCVCVCASLVVYGYQRKLKTNILFFCNPYNNMSNIIIILFNNIDMSYMFGDYCSHHIFGIRVIIRGSSLSFHLVSYICLQTLSFSLFTIIH